LTDKQFRRMALGMDGASEGAHMGHPDFRVNGRIFATLQHDRRFGMVVLTPDEQQRFLRDHPAAFAPESGAWGRAGCTRVRLEAVDEDTAGEAMTFAWKHIAAKGPARRSTSKAASKAATRPARRRGKA
jgi:hypothetical protein